LHAYKTSHRYDLIYSQEISLKKLTSLSTQDTRQL
jgi:hypothetical protein